MKTKQFINKLVFLFLFLLASNSSAQENIGLNNFDSTNTTIVVTAINIDTIIYNYAYFPHDSILTKKVLTTGVFHSDEVWENASQIKWFGIFKNKYGYYINKTKLIIDRVYDVVLDGNENEKTGWKVQTTNKDTSIILFEELNYLSPKPIKQAILAKNILFPGDTMRFNYLGINYEVFATGEKKLVQKNPKRFEVWNYNLYITATIKGQLRKSLLAAQPNFDDKMINLIFAGDIDGDGILDLIIDTSRHYNATSPTIYLSKPAKNSQIVKPIGGHTGVGC